MKLKILAIADNCNYQDLKKTLNNNHNIDLIFTLGDLSSWSLSLLKNIKIPIFGVYGNHCIKGYMKENHIINVHLKRFLYKKEIIIGGFEGSIRYKKEGSFMYTQEESLKYLKNFKYVDIFLSHSPPFGINDNIDEPHIGLKGIKKYIDKHSPKHFFHGHTYKNEKFVNKYKDTNIYYIYGIQILNIEV